MLKEFVRVSHMQKPEWCLVVNTMYFIPADFAVAFVEIVRLVALFSRAFDRGRDEGIRFFGLRLLVKIFLSAILAEVQFFKMTIIQHFGNVQSRRLDTSLTLHGHPSRHQRHQRTCFPF